MITALEMLKDVLAELREDTTKNLYERGDLCWDCAQAGRQYRCSHAKHGSRDHGHDHREGGGRSG